MPIGEAGLAGIRANGLRWKHRIRLGHWPELLGKMNDGEGRFSDDDAQRAALAIAENVRRFVKQYPWAQDTDLERRADELELVADCGLDEINFAMNDLYDSFDYHRILVERPAQGMAARSGETGTGSTEGNSPVAESHAPEPNQDTPTNTQGERT